MSDALTFGLSLREQTAEEIRALLGRRKMSATQLARQMGISQTYIWRRLSGETAFDLDDLEKIAEILKVEVTDLLPRPMPGRLVTTAGAGRLPNDYSGDLAVRTTRRRRTRTSRPNGGTRPEPTAPASPITPTQRRPMVSTAPGQRIAA